VQGFLVREEEEEVGREREIDMKRGRRLTKEELGGRGVGVRRLAMNGRVVGGGRKAICPKNFLWNVQSEGVADKAKTRKQGEIRRMREREEEEKKGREAKK
jgi:hypothetical protein